MDTIEDAPGGQSLGVVDYTFECADTDCRVRRIAIDETLGHPYRARVELVTTDVDLVVDELIGADVALHVDRDSASRVFRGCVLEVEHNGVASGRAFLGVTFGPALCLLARNRRSRIFQGLSIPEILQAVLVPVLSAQRRSVDLAGLSARGFRPRDYCVQYRETDLDFVHRLLEEEGLTYVFDQHSGKHETVVFLDAMTSSRDFFGAGGNAVVPVVPHGQDEAETESIDRITWRRRPRSPWVVQREWDWTTDPAQVHEDLVRDDEHPPAHPLAPALHEEHGDHRLLDLDLEARARRKRDAQAGDEHVIAGASNVVGFSPGTAFEVDDDELPGRHRLVQVVHHGDSPQADLFAVDGARAEYRNQFRCIPEGQPFRPRRSTPRPVISGPQTAVVTGPPGEEIHTDEHGRIKVRLHWDRGDAPPEESSCWIRVAQAWAGPGWGSMFLPRVGMEVVIFFLDGDPDRPLCMGSVYNGQNRPPYALPDERTKTTIKTRSTPGGEGFNELRFDDAADSEQVFLHAQRDLDEVVERNHSRSVGADETVSVGGDRSAAVEGTYSLKVAGRGRDGHRLAPPHCSIDVDEDYRLHAAKTIRVEAETSITLQCQQTVIELTPSSILLRSGDGASVVLDIQALLQSKPGAVVRLDPEGGVHCKSSAGSHLRLDSTVGLASKAGSHVTLTGEVEVGASGGEAVPGAVLKLSQDAELEASKVTLASEAATLELTTDATLRAINVEIEGTNASCTAAQSLELSGAKVDVSGVTLATITAPLVKVN